jgi:hypothetical protein
MSEAADAPKDDETNYSAMLDKMQSPLWKVRVALAYDLTAKATSLLALAQSDPRTAHQDFWKDFSGWRVELELAFAEPDAYIADSCKRWGIDVTKISKANKKGGVSEWKHVTNAIEFGVEKADQCVLDHLLEPVLEDKIDDNGNPVLDAAGEPQQVHQLLKGQRRRSAWALDPSTFPQKLYGEEHKAKALVFLGEPASREFAIEYQTFLEELQAGKLPPFTNAVTFWRVVRASGLFPRVVRYAFKALSVPFSNAAVERTFSVMKALEHKNRLLAGEEYLQNLMMHNCNRPWLAAMHTETCASILPAEIAGFVNFFEA